MTMQYPLLGHFRYVTESGAGQIVVTIGTGASGAVGYITMPTDVADLLGANELLLLGKDEELKLPFAIGYGLNVAAFSDTPLVISGDRAQWPRHWGRLLF